MMMKLEYRPDIDGLRAVAVLSVLAFHFGVPPFSGGFVGVDVFFVISGYLITGLLRSEITGGTFSFRRFYLRRFNRLYPALIATVAFSFPAAVLLLSVEEMANFGGQAIASLFSFSNIYFWVTTGYFDLESSGKPLLHTWSLSVEEQFYLLWPAFLVVGLKFSRFVLPAILIVTAASASAAAWLIDQQTSAVFYLLPFRVAEFGIGAALVWAPALRRNNGIGANALLVAGLALIAYPSVTFNELTAFPGLNAIVPCVGAAIAIHAGRASVIGKVLTNQVALWIGLRSYSLYLVHWPIIVFYRLLRPETSAADAPALFALSAVSAALLYQFVEMKFRTVKLAENLTPALRVAIASVAVAVVIAVPAASAWHTGGWIWRLPEIVRGQISTDPAANDDFVWAELRSRNVPFETPVAGDSEQPTSPLVLVVGDSMAGDFLNILAASGFTSEAKVRSFPIGAKCQPILPGDPSAIIQYIPETYRKTCEAGRELLLADSRWTKADVVIIAANWRDWSPAFLPETLTRVRPNGADTVFVVSSKSMSRSSQQLLMSAPTTASFADYRPHHLSAQAISTNDALRTAVAGPANFIDLVPALCANDGSCRLFDDEGVILLFDALHATKAGAKFLAEYMRRTGVLDLLASKHESAIHFAGSGY